MRFLTAGKQKTDGIFVGFMGVCVDRPYQYGASGELPTTTAAPKPVKPTPTPAPTPKPPRVQKQDKVGRYPSKFEGKDTVVFQQKGFFF